MRIGAQFRAGHLDRGRDAGGDVVGVDQQGGARHRALATCEAKAASSVSCSRVKACAAVPAVGMP